MYTFVHSYFPLIVHFHFTIYNKLIKEGLTDEEAMCFNSL
ncbi:protein of unknown function [[Clostridium] ultunense Esp]|uniref:Uncharacterized protein n=1 Tax=[Clostridium] ultunense Esp TaxID=1288971 RepID=A0A1M4PP52_9FIRM|nr:protein of unknown function [[Clostridium] ultunense Esp]